jgi:hypothetical protein
MNLESLRHSITEIEYREGLDVVLAVRASRRQSKRPPPRERVKARAATNKLEKAIAGMDKDALKKMIFEALGIGGKT